jgi:hypothetical protein
MAVFWVVTPCSLVEIVPAFVWKLNFVTLSERYSLSVFENRVLRIDNILSQEERNYRRLEEIA